MNSAITPKLHVLAKKSSSIVSIVTFVVAFTTTYKTLIYNDEHGGKHIFTEILKRKK